MDSFGLQALQLIQPLTDYSDAMLVVMHTLGKVNQLYLHLQDNMFRRIYWGSNDSSLSAEPQLLASQSLVDYEYTFISVSLYFYTLYIKQKVNGFFKLFIYFMQIMKDIVLK